MPISSQIKRLPLPLSLSFPPTKPTLKSIVTVTFKSTSDLNFHTLIKNAGRWHCRYYSCMIQYRRNFHVSPFRFHGKTIESSVKGTDGNHDQDQYKDEDEEEKVEEEELYVNAEQTKLLFPIPWDDLNFSFTKSSGPGGQNVNKLNTKVELRLNIVDESWLPNPVKGRLKEQQTNRINSK